jgi:GT2 family glycosyltransferase
VSEPNRLSVVIPSFGRPHPLGRLLGELASQDVKGGIELVVVDDGSPEPLDPLVQGHRPALGMPVTCLRQENQGVVAARNHGAQVASGQLLLFVDDDIGVPSDFVRRHLEAQAQVGPAAISAVYRVEPALSDSALAAWYAGRSAAWARGAAEGYREAVPGIFAVNGQLLSSTNFSVPAEAFRKVGGFDSGYRTPSCEDMDLGLRLAAAGTPVFRISTTTVIHLEPRYTLRQICERQEAGARETVRLVSRFPEVFGTPPIARSNGPLSLGAEPWTLSFKKIMRSALRHSLVAGPAFRLLELAPRLRIPCRLLCRSYDALVGAHIQSGWRAGLAQRRGTTVEVPS